MSPVNTSVPPGLGVQQPLYPGSQAGSNDPNQSYRRPSQRPDLTLATTPDPSSDPQSALSPGSAATGSSGQRSNSHTRSQSMSDHSQRSPPPVATQADLVRRHHTLSTSSSRLVRLERSRARLALQGVGLSEEDQEYYVPPSPVSLVGQPAAWSDVGHGSAPSTQSSLTVFANGSHIRTPSATSSVAAAWGSETSSLPTSPDPQHVTFPLSSSPASTASFESPLPSAKRSSFVVLRGGKGDAALIDRRNPISPPPVPSSNRRQVSPPKVESRNSLKPFLEAEGGNGEDSEEWERSIQDERDREEMELMRGASAEPVEDQQYLNQPFTSPALSSGSFNRGTSPFGAHHSQIHSRSNSQRQSIGSVGSDAAWTPSGEEAAVLRRHQSLTFRSGQEEDDGWGSHPRDRGASEEVLGSLALSSGSFSRSRSGTAPALSLAPTSLSHSNSASSHHGQVGSGNLSHSNSFSSHGHSGALSPVGGFSRSPWSPTVEETKQFGGMSAVVGTPPSLSSGRISRGGSESSRGSGHRSAHPGRVISEDDLVGAVAGLELGEQEQYSRKPTTPPTSTLDSRPQGAIGSSPSRGGDFVRREPVRSMTVNVPSSSNITSPTTRSRLPPLLTSPDILNSLASPSGSTATANPKTATQLNTFRQGPASAAAYVPPIGHSHLAAQSRLSAAPESPMGISSAAGGGGADWHRQKEMVLGGGSSTGASSLPSPSPFSTAVGVNPLEENWPADGGFGVGLAMQQQQQIQLLQSQMQQAMQVMDMMKAQGHAPPTAGFPNVRNTGTPFTDASSSSSPMPVPLAIPVTTPALSTTPQANGGTGPIDIPALIAEKGYNPGNFDLRPPAARFFVIKSYTEEDVHKSLKHEIWASTDLGNKRLDRAFRESGDKGPIYLFFSVNASGHFAGMAQMLTPVDYATSSNVWASDKWKGVLKVRWIYIKDVPLASLRHIRLSNTPENKPVTSSRDTQEVPYDAGLEVLRILATYNSRTSLLQDFAWYDARSTASAAAPVSGAPAAQNSAAPHQSHYARTQQNQPQQQQQQLPYQPAYHSQPPHGPMPQYGVPPPMMNMNGPPQPPPNGGRRYYGNNQMRGHTPPGAALY